MSNSDDDELVDVYINRCQVISGIFDITLEFSATLPVGVGADGRAAATEKKRTTLIRMSPQHAKAVAVLLVNAVLAYEQQNGALPQTAEMKANWETMAKRLR